MPAIRGHTLNQCVGREMTTPRELSIRWRDDAARLATYGDDRVAGVIKRLADELEAALRGLADEPLTLSQAALESGFSKDRLRHLVSSGELVNVGRKGSPRLRRGDLPRKSTAGGFDPAAAARKVVRATTAA